MFAYDYVHHKDTRMYAYRGIHVHTRMHYAVYSILCILAYLHEYVRNVHTYTDNFIIHTCKDVPAARQCTIWSTAQAVKDLQIDSNQLRGFGALRLLPSDSNFGAQAASTPSCVSELAGTSGFEHAS